ncbi:MAG: single-stranded DNA-binding protein, partial [Synechococcaceae cyanobacterium SM2_3_60]|nr:single-stranded DNA-binding protein [Synechococcaceae cyanobacterium SM2_3_60]
SVAMTLLIEFPGLREADPKARVRVSVFGEKAQSLPNEISKGQAVIVEGQLRMNVLERDGRSEKRAEINARRVYPVGAMSAASHSSGASGYEATASSYSAASSSYSNPEPRGGLEVSDDIPF